jgi:hypothetical protein
MESISPACLATQVAVLCEQRRWRRRSGQRVDQPVKLALFETDRGRQLAVDLERRQRIHLWAQAAPPQLAGMEVRNVKAPGQPYAEDQRRHSGLRHTRMGQGHRAWHLRFDDAHAAARFLAWYDAA